MLLPMPTSSSTRDDVLSRLEGFRDRDVKWRDGKAFAYVFHASEEAAMVAERAYQMYLWENALDPTVFPSTLRFETEIVAMAAHHLRGDDDVVGNFTSGGTESVMLAVKTARDYARAARPDMGVAEIVLPVTAHPCFHKAAQYFGMKAIVTPVDPSDFRADVDAMRAAITPNTVLLVGSSPSYAHGAIDPIEQIAALALEHELLMHVDGCIGGFLLPLLRDVGLEVPDFDFSVPGVTSISMDFHKYAYCPKGASVVLYKNDELRKHQIFTYSAWPGYSMVNPTIQSSKTCGPLAATWALLNYFGREGYLDIATHLLAARTKVIDRLASSTHLHVMGEPGMTLFALGSSTINLFQLVDDMKKRGYTLHPQMRLGELEPSVHFNLMPLNLEHMDGFLDALEDAAAAQASNAKADDAPSGLSAALASIDLTKIDDAQLRGLLEMVGLAGGDLPSGDMAEVNQILDSLPSDVTDRVLTIYFNQLSRYKGV